jgi:hypothetical protein
MQRKKNQRTSQVKDTKKQSICYINRGKKTNTPTF